MTSPSEPPVRAPQDTLESLPQHYMVCNLCGEVEFVADALDEEPVQTTGICSACVSCA